MSWFLLFLAGLFEVCWAIGLKYTDGFSRPLPTVLTVAAMAASLGLLGLAMRELPLGTAYAIWTGVGAVGTVIAGIVLFGESMALMRMISVGLIILGLVGLKVSTCPCSSGASCVGSRRGLFAGRARSHRICFHRACYYKAPHKVLPHHECMYTASLWERGGRRALCPRRGPTDQPLKPGFC